MRDDAVPARTATPSILRNLALESAAPSAFWSAVWLVPRSAATSRTAWRLSGGVTRLRGPTSLPRGKSEGELAPGRVDEPIAREGLARRVAYGVTGSRVSPKRRRPAARVIARRGVIGKIPAATYSPT